MSRRTRVFCNAMFLQMFLHSFQLNCLFETNMFHFNLHIYDNEEMEDLLELRVQVDPQEVEEQQND